MMREEKARRLNKIAIEGLERAIRGYQKVT
jgi:hypothetical protein